eukprot:symbB.v1.2.023587.t1/scaffold2168.1/size87162/1
MADGYMMNIPSIPFTRLAPLALEKSCDKESSQIIFPPPGLGFAGGRAGSDSSGATEEMFPGETGSKTESPRELTVADK